MSPKTGSLCLKMPFDAFNFDDVLQERGIHKRDHSFKVNQFYHLGWPLCIQVLVTLCLIAIG